MKFLALDSLRGLAAITVALVHLTAAGAFYDIPLVRNGGLAVPLFFVLSGFVISHAYFARLRTVEAGRAFMIRRFGRIYPLHLFTLALLVGLELAKLVLSRGVGIPSGQPPFSGSNDLSSLAANVFLLQAIIPFGTYSWNGPSWSISTEFYTYLLFAALLLGFRTRPLLAVAGAFLLSGAALVWLQLSDLNLHKTEGEGLLECVFGFFTGSLTYRLFLWTRQRWTPPGDLATFAAAAIVLGIFWFDPFGPAATILSFAVAISIFAFDQGSIARVLHARPFRFLGEISYSIYLIHFVILSGLNGTLRAAQSVLDVRLMRPVTDMIDFGPAGAMDLLALAYLCAVIGIAALTYRYIEVPGRRYFNRLSERSMQERVVAPIEQPALP